MAKITHQEIRDFFSTFEWFREPAKMGYLDAAIDRLAHTLNFIPKLPDPANVRVLEIGGIPYFMTVLIQKYLGYQVECANEPTWRTDKDLNVEVLENDHGERYEIPWRSLNIEFDDWPWEDGRFDLVIYCEVIEHMTYDPTHTLVEAHRVLKPERGQLVLSTPNALAWQYLVDNLHGRNFYPPFSGYNLYARHHRLFTGAELGYLCSKIGFEVTANYSTRDRAYLHPPKWEPIANLLGRLGRLKDRQDVLYLLATARGTARYVYPDGPPYQLYGDVHAYKHSSKGTLRMADNERAQLTGGFYELEDWGGGVRWTGPNAELQLVYDGERKLSVTFHTGTPKRGASVRGSVAVGAEDGSIVERADFEAATGTWETVVVPVPDDLSERVKVTITVADPMVPNQIDPGSGDKRELGVAVREVGLT